MGVHAKWAQSGNYFWKLLNVLIEERFGASRSALRPHKQGSEFLTSRLKEPLLKRSALKTQRSLRSAGLAFRLALEAQLPAANGHTDAQQHDKPKSLFGHGVTDRIDKTPAT